MILGTYTQQPNEVLDYDIDFSDWLPASDYITAAAATVTVAPDNTLVVASTSIDTTGKIVKQWVSGGSNGNTYEVQVRVSTHGGRTKEAEFRLRVKEF